jgi:hypothetical protein
MAAQLLPFAPGSTSGDIDTAAPNYALQGLDQA